MEFHQIFEISGPDQFGTMAIQLFRHHYRNNAVYREFCDHLSRTPDHVTALQQIPFLPIDFFKTRAVVTSSAAPQITFSSSGTTGTLNSKHQVPDLQLYEESYTKAFQLFYGNITNYCVLALLPSYLEREGSSLVHMVHDLIKKSAHPDSGFYLDNRESLRKKLRELDAQGQQVLLIGVSFALLDLVEDHPLTLRNTLVMETGGMKGRRKEMIREELHEILKEGLGVKTIHSEYGMTELLSQAYSQGNGLFRSPPWMKIFIRDTEDPLSLQGYGKTGGVNVMDLANIHSCPFIATQDLGKLHADGSFEILGRFDHSDIRGCNLMVL